MQNSKRPCRLLSPIVLLLPSLRDGPQYKVLVKLHARGWISEVPKYLIKEGFKYKMSPGKKSQESSFMKLQAVFNKSAQILEDTIIGNFSTIAFTEICYVCTSGVTNKWIMECKDLCLMNNHYRKVRIYKIKELEHCYLYSEMIAFLFTDFSQEQILSEKCEHIWSNRISEWKFLSSIIPSLSSSTSLMLIPIWLCPFLQLLPILK